MYDLHTLEYVNYDDDDDMLAPGLFMVLFSTAREFAVFTPRARNFRTGPKTDVAFHARGARTNGKKGPFFKLICMEKRGGKQTVSQGVQ